MAGSYWKRFGIYDFRKYEYIVSIDLGHRHTSAHYAKLEYNSDGVLEGKIPERAYILDESSVIPTQFSEKEGRVILGDVSGKQSYMYFKRNPSELSEGVKCEYTGEECKVLIQKYITQVINNIEALNAELTGKEILYIVGCPSGGEWLKNDNDVRYAEILSEKNGRDIVVLHESRAALIKVKKERSITLSKGEGIFVFDFGSSTSDWTFMYLDDDGILRMMDGTDNLGAKLIDEKIMNLILKENNVSYSDIDKIMKHRSDTIHAKELGFDGYGNDDFDNNILVYTRKNGEVIVHNVLPAYLEKVTGEAEVCYNTVDDSVKGSWQKLLRCFMQSAYDKVRKALPGIGIKNIMLTGGASKMYFIKQMAEKVFEGVSVILDTVPSVSVSKGLVYAGLADIGAERLIDRALQELDELMNDYSERDKIKARFIKAGMEENAAADKAEETVKKLSGGFLQGVAWACAEAVAYDKQFYEEVFDDSFKAWGDAYSRIENYSGASSLYGLQHIIQEKGESRISGMTEKIKSAILSVADLYTEQARLIVSTNVREHYGVEVPDNLNVNIDDKTEELSKVIARLHVRFLSYSAVRGIFGRTDGYQLDWEAGRPLYFELRQLTQTTDSRMALYKRYLSVYEGKSGWAKDELRREMHGELEKSKTLEELSEKFKSLLYQKISKAISSMSMFVS